VVSEIRGRTRGAGSEFVLATDVRFASEKAVLGQFEVGVGAVPGGGPMARLGRLVGGGRALEILLGGEDVPAGMAAEFGYVNRLVPDAEIESVTDASLGRVATSTSSLMPATASLSKAAIRRASGERLAPESSPETSPPTQTKAGCRVDPAPDGRVASALCTRPMAPGGGAHATAAVPLSRCRTRSTMSSMWCEADAAPAGRGRFS
jgi:hypothetical protein